MKIISKIAITIIIVNFSISLLNAQNTAITDDASYSPNSSAMLDVKSTDKGILIPRLTSAQRTLVSSPATGLLVFDTDENNFYFYNGTSWVNLSSANANNILGYSATDKVYLKDVNHNFGIGTTTPSNKLEVKADADNGLDQAIFNVVNNTGDTVFAVYQQGVRINVYDDPLAKAKSSKGGFAVGGFKPAKGTMTNEYLRITPDSIRMYIEENSTVKATSRKGGFAVGGFKPAKATAPTDYFNIFGANSADVINPSQSRIFWYPVKEAFLAGRVLVESPDSVGTNSFASGYESRAIGNYSQALGYQTLAKGEYSTAIGKNSRAIATNSFAFGDNAKAKADDSYAFGSGAEANGISSYAFGSAARDSVGNVIGFVTTASGRNSIAFGQGALAKKYNSMSIGTSSDASGDNSMAIGSASTASGSYSTAFGVSSTASGITSMALGNYANATGKNAIALGTSAIASGSYDVAIGYQAKATGGYSAALGKYSQATGSLAVALGACTASGSPSVAMGVNSESIGGFSTAIGGVCLSIGTFSTAIGDWNKTYGDHSLATGSYTVANGTFSSSFGNYTNAKAYNSAVFGQYNDTTGTATSWVVTDPLFIVANGSSTSARNNALTVLKNGNIGIDVEVPTRKLEVNGNAKIGANGTTITNIIKQTVSLNLANIAAGASLAQTFTVTNAAVGSSVYVSPSTDLTDGLVICYARVSALNTVTVKFKNTTVSAIDMGLINWYFTVIE